jgi:hypothetical protein
MRLKGLPLPSQSIGPFISREIPVVFGSAPSTAAATRAGERKARLSVMRTLRSEHLSRLAISCVLLQRPCRRSSSQALALAMPSTRRARVSARIGRLNA